MTQGYLCVGLSGALGGVTAFSVDQNLASAIGALVVTVGITLTAINWIDKRIDGKIKPLLLEIKELRHLMVDKRKSDNAQRGEHARSPR